MKVRLPLEIALLIRKKTIIADKRQKILNKTMKKEIRQS